MSDKQLRKPEFIKVQDILKGRSGFNVYVKVLEANHREIDTRDGNKITMVDCVVADETASAKAFFKSDNAKDIKKDVVIAIRNGMKKLIKRHISLEIDIFGLVTIEKKTIEKCNTDKNISNEEIQFQRRNNRRFDNKRNRNQSSKPINKSRRNNQDRNDRPQKNYNKDERSFKEERGERDGRKNRRGDRRPNQNDGDYDRRENKNRNQQERKLPRKFQQPRGKRTPFTKINEIDPGADGIRLVAKVMSATLVSGKNGRPDSCRCVLGDQTGIVKAFLQQSDYLVVGKSIALFDAEARVSKEHIELQRGRVEEANRKIEKVNEKFDLSAKAWVPID